MCHPIYFLLVSFSFFLGISKNVEFIDPVVLSPISDAIVIRQDRKVVGNAETLDIFGDTHVAYLLFDIITAKDVIQKYLDSNKNPVDIRLRFVINWGPNVGTPLSLRRATFPGLIQWNDNSLTFDIAEKVEVGPELGVTFVPRNEWTVEYDLGDEILTWLATCDLFRPECRYITFQFSAKDPHWVKVYSKESYREKYRPQLYFSEGPFALSLPVIADSGVVRQLPERGFGKWPTLDLIFYSHVAFMEFNLVESIGHIQSIHETTKIKLRLWVEWAQAAWGTMIAEVVQLGVPLDETSFKWGDADSPSLNVIRLISTEHVSSGAVVEFDLTPLLTTKGDSETDRMKLTFWDLTHFQIRLRTDQNAWVKIASKEYHDASKRPAIVFAPVSWTDSLRPAFLILWSIYNTIIPPIYPLLLGIGLAAVIQSTRRLVWPIIHFVVNYSKYRQSYHYQQQPLSPRTSSPSKSFFGRGTDSFLGFILHSMKNSRSLIEKRKEDKDEPEIQLEPIRRHRMHNFPA